MRGLLQSLQAQGKPAPEVASVKAQLATSFGGAVSALRPSL